MAEKVVSVDSFKPRLYQRNLIEALEHRDKRKFVIVWPRRCLSGDSHITMADGSWKLLKDIEVGDKILSWDGSKFVSDTVKNKWTTGVKRAKRVKSFGYLPLISSDDHRFASLVQGNNSLKWRKLSEIKSRHQCLQYSGIGFGEMHNPDLAEFVGYMITDGYCSGYQQPKFTNTNIDILKRVELLVKRLFDVTVIWREKGNGFDLGFSNGTNGGGATSNPIKELFREYGQDVSKDKRRVLPIIWGMDEESLGRFFAAVISSDGSIYAQKKGFTGCINRCIPPANEITINCGVSYLMGWDIYWLLRKIGIVAQVPYNERNSNLKVKVSKGHAVKWLLSNGPIYGKTVRQDEVLSKIVDNPQKRSLWNNCWRMAIKMVDDNDQELYDIETEVNHNFIANGYIVHNSGKDVTALNLMLRQAFKRVGSYYYLFPKRKTCREAIWDGIMIDGRKYLDFIPKELVAKKNNVEMKLTLINGSIIQFHGADMADNLRGTNPLGVIFSEYSRVNHPQAYDAVIAPILAANDGWVMFISTPNKRNNFFDLYKYGQSDQDNKWYTELLTVDDTKHMSPENLAAEKERLSDEVFQCEYYCSFDSEDFGEYYTRYLADAYKENRIGEYYHDSSHVVHTAWDLGWKCSMVVLFFQVINRKIYIIDHYHKSNKDLAHFANKLQQFGMEKKYNYGTHFFPHDVTKHSINDGNSRLYILRSLGLEYDILSRCRDKNDDIEFSKHVFKRIYIDDKNCSTLLDALEAYSKVWDKTICKYIEKPRKSWANDHCDAFMYVCRAAESLEDDDMSTDEFEREYLRLVYGIDTTQRGY